MDVYIAAPYQFKGAALVLRDLLSVHDIGCTAEWLDANEPPSHAEAIQDLADIARSDAFIAISPESYVNMGTGGRHVEFGYAIALRKPLFLLGVKTNVFHELAAVCIVSTVAELIAAIGVEIDV